MEERASSVNSCFSLGRWSESLINCAMGAESNKWGSIPLTQIGILLMSVTGFLVSSEQGCVCLCTIVQQHSTTCGVTDSLAISNFSHQKENGLV